MRTGKPIDKSLLKIHYGSIVYYGRRPMTAHTKLTGCILNKCLLMYFVDSVNFETLLINSLGGRTNENWRINI